MRPGIYVYAKAATIDPSRRDMFIAGAGLDSIFKHNSRGVLYHEQGPVLRFRLSVDVPR
jgi:hypothetical protein